MLEMAACSQFAQRFRAIRIIFLVMVISLVLYIGVGYFVLADRSSIEVNTISEEAQLVFYGLAAGLIGAVLFVRRSFLPSPEKFTAPGSNLSKWNRYKCHESPRGGFRRA